MAINVGTLRSLSLNSRLFPLVLPSFGSFAVLGPAPQCPGIIHGGLLHVPSFGQMYSLFAPISNLRARFLQLAPPSRFVHWPQSRQPLPSFDNRQPQVYIYPVCTVAMLVMSAKNSSFLSLSNKDVCETLVHSDMLCELCDWC